jgi:iron(III) transport system substrate-binding protein
MRKLHVIFLVWFVLLFAVACGDKKTQDADSPGVVNVYTHRHYDTDKELFAAFTEATGIAVNVVSASADELIQKLAMEGERSPADVLITVDAGRLVKAKEMNLLQPVSSALLNSHVPVHLRDADGNWFGLTQRARVFVYAKDRVKAEELVSYESLADPRWKGKILIRSSDNIYNQSLLASIIAHQGEEAAAVWAAGIVANMAVPPKGGDRDQIKAVAAGTGDIAIVNTYYFGKMAVEGDEEERKLAEGLGVFFPNQTDRGTHVNISGAGVTRYAPNRQNAIRFIDYLASNEAQAKFAQANYEYPVKPGVAIAPILESWGTFKADELPLENLGTFNAAAVKVFDRAGWK